MDEAGIWEWSGGQAEGEMELPKRESEEMKVKDQCGGTGPELGVARESGRKGAVQMEVLGRGREACNGGESIVGR